MPPESKAPDDGEPWLLYLITILFFAALAWYGLTYNDHSCEDGSDCARIQQGDHDATRWAEDAEYREP